MEVEYITNRIAGGIQKLVKRIERDVEEMCKRILIPLTKEFGKQDLPAELLETERIH